MTEQQTAPSDEDVAKTLAEYERIAQGTGEWDGREATEFSNDGVTWSPVWVKTAEHAHPLAARSTVHRKGVLIPTTEYAVWDEAFPAEEPTWQKIWTDRPRVLFGAWVARRALKTAFRAALADKREPDDLPDARAAEHSTMLRDWDAEIASALTVEQLDSIWADARVSRERTGPREKSYRERRGALIEAEWSTPSAPAAAAGATPHPVPAPPKTKLTKPEPRRQVPAHHRPRDPRMSAALANAVAEADRHGRRVDRTVRRAVREQGQP